MITVYDEAGQDKKNYTDFGGCYSPLRNSSCLRDLGRGEREVREVREVREPIAPPSLSLSPFNACHAGFNALIG